MLEKKGNGIPFKPLFSQPIKSNEFATKKKIKSDALQKNWMKPELK